MCDDIPAPQLGPDGGVADGSDLLSCGSSLDFNGLVWSDTADHLSMLHDVRHEVYRGLEEAGIDIPFDPLVLRSAPDALPKAS